MGWRDATSSWQGTEISFYPVLLTLPPPIPRRTCQIKVVSHSEQSTLISLPTNPSETSDVIHVVSLLHIPHSSPVLRPSELRGVPSGYHHHGPPRRDTAHSHLLKRGVSRRLRIERHRVANSAGCSPSWFSVDIHDLREMNTRGFVFSDLLTVSVHLLSIFPSLFSFISLRLHCISFSSFVFSLLQLSRLAHPLLMFWPIRLDMWGLSSTSNLTAFKVPIGPDQSSRGLDWSKSKLDQCSRVSHDLNLV